MKAETEPKSSGETTDHQDSPRRSISSNEGDKEVFDVGTGTGAEKLERVARRTIEYRNNDHRERSICPNCFLTQVYCLCDYNRDLFAPIREPKSPEYQLNVKFHLFTHFKEYTRASNTGKLLHIGLPEHTSVKLFGIRSEEEELIQELSSNPCFILYPKPGVSVSIDQFKEIFSQINNSSSSSFSSSATTTASSSSSSERPPPQQQLLHICVIDSTWSQSISMEKALPAHLPRVHLDEYSILNPSKFLNRKQSKTKTKICTIESIMLAISALGVSPNVLEIFHQSLEFAVDTLLKQSAKKPVYGNKIIPKIPVHLKEQEQQHKGGAPVYLGPVTLADIKKPPKCLQCNTTEKEVSAFKNCGLRSRRKDFANWNETIEREQEERIASIVRDMNPEIEGYPENLAEIQSILRKEPLYRMWKCPHCMRFFPSKEDEAEHQQQQQQQQPQKDS
jgi:DTW domain-containing protein YfiP